MIAFGNCVLEEKFMRCLMTLFCQQIDNDLSISRNVSSNKMIHAILALVFFDKVILIVPFFCSNARGVTILIFNNYLCISIIQCDKDGRTIALDINVNIHGEYFI